MVNACACSTSTMMLATRSVSDKSNFIFDAAIGWVFVSSRRLVFARISPLTRSLKDGSYENEGVNCLVL